MEYRGYQIKCSEIMPGVVAAQGIGQIRARKPVFIASSNAGTAMALAPSQALADAKSQIDRKLGR